MAGKEQQGQTRLSILGRADAGRELYALELLAGKNTALHRLHPGAKLISCVLFMATVISFDRYSLGRLCPFLFYPCVLIALLGANGVGKTSLPLALVGILPLSSASVSVAGVELDPDNPGDLRRKVGLVFQNPEDQLFMPSIYEDLVFGPRNLGLSEDAARRADGALELLGISRLKDRSPLRLSGGEKRLAAIATVLTMRPEVMLFDEPTAFLDPRARRSLIAALKPLPHTKIIATHDLPFAA